MSHLVSPGAYHSTSGGVYRPRTYFLVEIFQRYGVKAAFALACAALFAFAPLTFLYWFNEFRCQPVSIVNVGRPVVVKPGRFQEDQNHDEPGESALLKVICQVPGIDGYRDLLCDNDPVRRGLQVSDSKYVRRELVYLRRAGNPQIPFGLLGKPPVSVWVPAGDYEILVVYEAPRAEYLREGQAKSYPLVTAIENCSLESQRQMVCRVPLPHYNWGGSEPLEWVAEDGSVDAHALTATELNPLLQSYTDAMPIPTPGGYLLSLAEPSVLHSNEHQKCGVNLHDVQVISREWTRDQLATLRNWLPADAVPARARLSALVDCLQWREFLEGWFCYALAGVSGLVFTRWGTLTLLDPWRRRNAMSRTPVILMGIAVISATLWFLHQCLSISLAGPIEFLFHI
jgi:hypothetical protein